MWKAFLSSRTAASMLTTTTYYSKMPIFPTNIYPTGIYKILKKVFNIHMPYNI